MDSNNKQRINMLAQGLKPSSIKRHLDQYVVGQDDAKKVLSVVVYAHYKELAKSDSADVEIAKSNILLIGPTGTGKTLLCETLSKVLGVPFVTADATSLGQTKYVAEEIESILLRLLDKANGDMERAQNGIVFIDEVDKLKAGNNPLNNASGGSVQQALLKIMEGSNVKIGTSGVMDTSNILFICGGAFVGLEHIMSKTHAFGFVALSEGNNQRILDRLNSRVKPTDLIEFGLIPEFAGRLPIVTNLQALTKEMLVRIIAEPKNSIYNQFREILKNEGVELIIEPRVFDEIAELAVEYKVGARSLRGIFEEMITPVLYVVPDRPDIKRVVIRSLFEDAQIFGDVAKAAEPG